MQIVNGFLKCCFRCFILISSPSGIENMLGFACNLRIPEAILQPALSVGQRHFLFVLQNFSSVFRDVHKAEVIVHVTGICKHYCYIFERFT
jgi:hypothetical protein